MFSDISIFLRFILFSIPQAMIIIASYKYLRARNSIDAQFMLWGTIITLLSFIPTTFYFLFVDINDFSTIQYNLVSGVCNFVGLAGGFLFAFGFLRLIKKHIQYVKTNTSDEVDQIGKS